MSDSHTTRLDAALAGRYRIERKLGEGGMASVYLAEDVKHERKVALKILRPELAAVIGGERFLAEIKTTANLQHPHILALFDSGEADGFLYYVMPYVEGETLRDRLDREGQLGVDEAVRIAREVADALDYAHRHGVIHRDIKPANILLHDGRPVVADFGIALAISAAGGGRMTETGLSLGTPHYMSPEQASADRDLSARSDVYSLGCVLYEMLAGQPPHTGPSAQSILVRILTEDPRPIGEMRRSVPAHVAAAVTKAIEKLPADRFDSARAFIEALGDAAFTYAATPRGATTSAAAPAKPAAATPWLADRRSKAAIGVTTLAVLVGAYGWMRGAGRAPERPAVFELDIPADAGRVDDFAVSRDGMVFAIQTRTGSDFRLWIRRVDEADFRPVPGTEGAQYVDFSPDGEWLVFRSRSRNALLKVAVSGGGALPILEVDSIRPHDPHWGEDGTIVFTGPDGTWRISETGEGGAHRLSRTLNGPGPQVLPDGAGALASGDNAIHYIDFETDSAHRLIDEGNGPKYLPTGHILYTAVGGGLFVVPFDLGRHRVTGSPAPVLDGVAGSGGFGYYVSRSGTLVYEQGEATGQRGPPDRRLLFLDRTGRPDTVRLTPRPIASPAISPDGRYVAYETFVGGDTEREQIQILDLVTGGTPELTSEGQSFDPVWSPDGTRIAIGGEREDTDDRDLFVVPVGDGSAATRVTELPGSQYPTAWSAEDLIAFESNTRGNTDLGIAPLEEGAEPRAYLQADYYEGRLHISPDGTLAAYTSRETGENEVYVRGFPEPVGKWRISVGGGDYARWSPDGDELYFWRNTPSPDSLFAVSVRRAPDFVPGEPVLLFAGDYIASSWDVHPDGRFLVVQDVNAAPVGAGTGPAPEPRYLVVLNWFTELEERLGRGRR